MKYVVLMFALFTVGAAADQRMETRDGFCHAVTPEGFQTANDDNEVFLSNCVNSIRQDADGNGDGSFVMKVKYPDGSYPFGGNYTTSGAETGINCVMVDSNGTNYVTQDWDSTYKVKVKDRKDFKKAWGTDDEEFDFNNDGIVGYADIPLFYEQVDIEIKYTVVCRNGAQQ